MTSRLQEKKRAYYLTHRERLLTKQLRYTDEHPSYRGVKHFRDHDTVEHRKEEWVRGDVHTNTVENVWSLFKRSIVGSYHKVSEKHLDAYLDELEWRFNNRENPYLFRDTLMKLLGAQSLPYRELVSE